MPDIWETAAILAKLLLFIGILGATGLVIIRMAFADLVSPVVGRMRRQATGLAGLSIMASAFGFMLRGAALTGGADGMSDPEILGLLWQTPAGDVLILRLLGAGMIILGLWVDRFGNWIALCGGLVALWSFAQIGHILEAPVMGVQALLFLHLVGISFWIGVLGPLRDLSRQPEHLDRAARLGHGFGQIAMVSVPAVLLAGVAMAWLLLGDPRALVTTGYGQTLLVKLALVAAVLMLATANKLRFVPAMQTGDHRAAGHLVRSIEFEAALILAALLVTAVLTSVLTLPN
ncbi:copper resistance D family protein [Phycobacter sp. K97]|uniref:copper resistance D family protein n=1 Tax=Phycobacter sedimenti TaxID=3133977 RepID=UPI00311D3039